MLVYLILWLRFAQFLLRHCFLTLPQIVVVLNIHPPSIYLLILILNQIFLRQFCLTVLYPTRLFLFLFPKTFLFLPLSFLPLPFPLYLFLTLSQICISLINQIFIHIYFWRLHTGRVLHAYPMFHVLLLCLSYLRLLLILFLLQSHLSLLSPYY